MLLRTINKNVPKQRKNNRGPARSASSMMRSSTRLKGFRTVRVFARICAKLKPSSKQSVSQAHPHHAVSLRTFQQRWLPLKATRPKCRPPTACGLYVSAITWRYALRVNASLRADIAVKAWARATVERAANGARRVELERNTLRGWCAVVLILGGGCAKSIVVVVLPHIADVRREGERA